MKIFYRILAVLALAGMVAGFMIFDSKNIAPKQWSVRRETLASEKIGEQLDGIRILYFSDLKYGTFMDEKRLNALQEKISLLPFDAVVFGGDIFDENVRAENLTPLYTFFSSINAPLGKFAVMGDTDRSSEALAASALDIYEKCDFEILNNSRALLHNRGSQAVILVGLDNGLNGLPDPSAAYESVSPSSYVITVCHTPDSADTVKGELTDYFLSGHSLGGQSYHLFSYEYTPAMAVRYFRGKYELSDFTLDITSGTGTTGTDQRFLCNAEVVLYTLQHVKEEAPVTPQETEPAETAPAESAEPSESAVPQESEMPAPSEETEKPEENKEP